MSGLVILILLCELLLISFGIYLIFSFINKTPFYPSSLKKLNELKNFKELDLLKYKRFIDVGSGDGRIVRWAVRNGFDSSHGIDYNPYLTIYSRLMSVGNSKVKIFNKNFQDHNFSEYDMVYMYIFSEHIDNLKEKLYSEMKQGSVIVTNTFKFSTIEPDLVFNRFYIYYIK